MTVDDFVPFDSMFKVGCSMFDVQNDLLEKWFGSKSGANFFFVSAVLLTCLTLSAQAAKAAAGQEVLYEPTIRDIVNRDCARCHSGAARNLMDYDGIKAYADSGMLKVMVSSGGAMSRFAGQDSGPILQWIADGALEKAGPQVVAGRMHAGTGAKAYPVDVPLDKMTYSNTIQFIIARDCLECHSGTFRNLTTYKNLKYYADSGLLVSLVSPGGQMHRFAGPNYQYFEAWATNGAPR
nr:hypothetical protein [Desulfobulbaceae bacterium]